jgi:hypothetical protein
MPDRLDLVQIQLASVDEPLVISGDARDELVRRLEHRADGASAAKAFLDVGASSPVTFTIEEKQTLLLVIEAWGDELGDWSLLPDGLFAVRNALVDDLDDVGLHA